MDKLSKNQKFFTKESENPFYRVVELHVEGEDNWYFRGETIIHRMASPEDKSDVISIHLYRTQGKAYICWQAKSAIMTRAAVIETTEELISFLGMTKLAKEVYQGLSDDNLHLAPYLLGSYKKVIF